MTPDGSAVIGYVPNHAADPSVARGFRWTQQFGFEDLGGITGRESGVYPLDLSSSGNVVVGWNIPPGDPVHEGFTWTPETGMVSLGENMSPSNVSADGSVIVGRGDDGQPFRYTDETGVEYLGPLPEGWSLAVIDGLSADGSTIIGGADALAVGTPYLWTEAGGFETLLPLPGLTSLSRDNTTDGHLRVRRTVQSLLEAHEGRPFMWRNGRGTQFVDDILAGEFNLADQIAGWELIGVHLSADGTIIAGDAINPDGIREPWMVISIRRAISTVTAFWTLATRTCSWGRSLPASTIRGSICPTMVRSMTLI